MDKNWPKIRNGQELDKDQKKIGQEDNNKIVIGQTLDEKIRIGQEFYMNWT